MADYIEIDSFNPYENRFPGRKLIDIGALSLIKRLRQEGIHVVIKPVNSTPVQYLFKKGFQEFLSSPVNSFLIGIPTGVVCGIVGNLLTELIKKKRIDRREEKASNIIIINQQQNIYINGNGKALTKSEFKDMESKKWAKKKEFDKCFSQISPYANLPTPIFLEHRPKIVGWCSLEYNETGLVFSDSRIADKNVFRKIKSGKLGGASVTGIAEKATCSICTDNYVDCPHISGDLYNGIMCNSSIRQSTLVEVSLVKEPVNSECLIQIVSQN